MTKWDVAASEQKAWAERDELHEETIELLRQKLELEDERDKAVREHAEMYGLMEAAFKRRQATAAECERLAGRVAALTEALHEAHEFKCGCEHPGSFATCVAVPRGSFAALADVGVRSD